MRTNDGSIFFRKAGSLPNLCKGGSNNPKEDAQMKKRLIVAVAMLTLGLFATASLADTKKGGKIDGKKEFEEHCAVCHKDGGNMITPTKTLSKKDRAANGVKSARDIIKLIRKPGAGMTAFDIKTISDKEAKAIAEYILKTFK
jgi:cytochrome c6